MGGPGDDEAALHGSQVEVAQGRGHNGALGQAPALQRQHLPGGGASGSASASASSTPQRPPQPHQVPLDVRPQQLPQQATGHSVSEHSVAEDSSPRAASQLLCQLWEGGQLGLGKGSAAAALGKGGRVQSTGCARRSSFIAPQWRHHSVGANGVLLLAQQRQHNVQHPVLLNVVIGSIHVSSDNVQGAQRGRGAATAAATATAAQGVEQAQGRVHAIQAIH